MGGRAERCNCVKARWKRSELKAPEPEQSLIGNHTEAKDGSVCWELTYLPYRQHSDAGKTHVSYQCLNASGLQITVISYSRAGQLMERYQNHYYDFLNNVGLVTY